MGSPVLYGAMVAQLAIRDTHGKQDHWHATPTRDILPITAVLAAFVAPTWLNMWRSQ